MMAGAITLRARHHRQHRRHGGVANTGADEADHFMQMAADAPGLFDADV